MNDKVIVLPNLDDMAQRLDAMGATIHEEERFHPILMQSAGRDLVSWGVVTMLAMAIHDHTQGMPPIMSNMMFMGASRYVDVLVDDEDVKRDAKEHLSNAMKACAAT